MAWTNPQLNKVLGRLSLARIGWNVRGRGTTGEPVVQTMKDTAGVTWYLFMTTTGQLAVTTSLPTADSSAASEGGLLVADKTLTSAQILALNATPIQVIAAPGANKSIVVERVFAYTAGGTAYGGIAAGEDLALRYTDSSGTIQAVFETTGWLDQTTAQYRTVLPSSAAGTALNALTPTANAAIMAHMLVGEITTGDYAIKLRVLYRIVNTVL